MRLPVAATDPTGRGFTWTVEGELVMVSFTCDRDLRDPDLGCGCGRSFAGLNSRKATTRAVVREVNIDLPTLNEAVRASLAAGGWLPAEGELSDEDCEFLVEVTAQMVEIGETFAEGTVLRRRLDDITIAC